MILLLDLPAELRQHIIRMIPGGFPDELRLDRRRWPDPVNQLLVTCKLLRADMIELMRTWSFDCLIPRSIHIELVPRLIRAMERLGLKNKVRKIRLMVWYKMRRGHIRGYVDPLQREVVLEMSVLNWITRLSRLPRGNIKTVVIDATPLPQHMLDTCPHLINTNLQLSNTYFLYWGYNQDLLSLIMHLSSHFNGTAFEQDTFHVVDQYPERGCSTRIVLGGKYAEEFRPSVEELVPDAGGSTMSTGIGACTFAGTFCSSEPPTHLSVHHLVQRCGIRLDTGGFKERFAMEVSGIEPLPPSQQNEIDPSTDFTALSPLFVSLSSAGAYYISAVDDEKNTRSAVVRLLTFAARTRESGVETQHLDFLPAPPAREKLVGELCNDLGLAHKSIHGRFGKFIRVFSALDRECQCILSGRWGRLRLTRPWVL